MQPGQPLRDGAVSLDPRQQLPEKPAIGLHQGQCGPGDRQPLIRGKLRLLQIVRMGAIPVHPSRYIALAMTGSSLSMTSGDRWGGTGDGHSHRCRRVRA